MIGIICDVDSLVCETGTLNSMVLEGLRPSLTREQPRPGAMYRLFANPPAKFLALKDCQVLR